MLLAPLIAGSAALVGIARTVIVGLGFGVITFVGLSAVSTQLVAAMQASINFPSEFAVVGCLLRLQDVVSILGACLAARVAMIPAKRFGLI